jgi:hypothetical protein
VSAGGRVVGWGLSFDTPLPYTAILARLTELGPWAWYDRDSAYFGNIAAARTKSVALDVYESGGNQLPGGRVDAGNGQAFAISVRPRREHPPSADEWAALEHRIRTVILPALGATGIQPTEPID